MSTTETDDISNIPAATNASGASAVILKRKLFEAIGKGNWKKALVLITKMESFSEIVQPEHSMPGVPTGWTILQLACNLECEQEAERNVRRIFEILESFEYEPNEMDEFVNYPNSNGDTALNIALSRSHEEVVENLLRNSADVSLKETEKCKSVLKLIYEQHHKVLLRIYGNSFEIEKHKKDESNELAWSLGWNFSPIVGRKSQYDNEDYTICQTRLLTTVLTQPGIKRSEILLHPLVQIFLYEKYTRFSWLIWASVLYHFLGSLACVTFLISRTKLVDMELYGTTCSFSPECKESDYSYVPHQDIFSSWPAAVLMTLFYMLSLAKEIVEVTSCPSLSYYWQQYENPMQWFLLISIPMATISPAIGVVAYIFLILEQTTKIRKFEYYSQLLLRSFKRFLKFFATISLTLVAFIYTLSRLLALKPQFQVSGDGGFGKILSMMVGELNYDSIFSPDKKDCVPHPITTRFVFLFFMISVVIMIQNLMIGLMVTDVEKLKRKYKASHLAARLEVIYLMEWFLTEAMLRWLAFKKRNRRNENFADARARLGYLLLETELINEEKFIKMSKELRK